MAGSRTEGHSGYFKLVEAADRVWAAVATDLPATVGNAAIVDLGGRTLVVDTFITSRAAAELREAARRLTGHETAWVVNTHFHNDHCGGNEVFAVAAAIAATEWTRQAITERAAGLPERIAAAEARLAEMGGAAGDGADPEVERRRQELRSDTDTLKRLNVVAPDVGFTDRLTLFGERRRVEVTSVGAAHTQSDAVVFLPEERLLIAGDVVLVRNHPWTGDGNVRSWISVLGRLGELGAATVIPGHGEVGEGTAVGEMADYMRDLLGLIEAAVAAGGPGAKPEDLPVPDIPERWRGWGWGEGWQDDFPAAVKAAG
jgi:cyclase